MSDGVLNLLQPDSDLTHQKQSSALNTSTKHPIQRGTRSDFSTPQTLPFAKSERPRTTQTSPHSGGTYTTYVQRTDRPTASSLDDRNRKACTTDGPNQSAASGLIRAIIGQADRELPQSVAAVGRRPPATSAAAV